MRESTKDKKFVVYMHKNLVNSMGALIERIKYKLSTGRIWSRQEIFSRKQS